MLYLLWVWAWGIETIRVLAHEEFIAPKNIESEALKHLKGFILLYLQYN